MYINPLAQMCPVNGNFLAPFFPSFTLLLSHCISVSHSVLCRHHRAPLLKIDGTFDSLPWIVCAVWAKGRLHLTTLTPVDAEALLIDFRMPAVDTGVQPVIFLDQVPFSPTELCTSEELLYGY